MIAAKFWTMYAFLLIPGLVLAGGDINSRGERCVRVIMSGASAGALRLEARQAPWAQVLNELTNETGVRVHYSVLPQGLVTATCVGTTVKQVVECLLGPEADLVFRYPRGSLKTDSLSQPAEVWVLDNPAGQPDCTAQPPAGCGLRMARHDTAPTPHPNPLPEGELRMGLGVPTQTEPGATLVAMAQTEDPAQRAEAISRLMTEGRADDVSVREALGAALSDEDASVRAQAISSLAHREGAGAAAALQQALHDSDASVRLMAVDSAEDDAALLQEALADSDETVRTLAAMKLEQLAKAQ